uniref:Transposase n=1 Tax=Steinernema glaseri TaxID=37863 RepID=A0A1I7ZEV4_9BILA
MHVVSPNEAVAETCLTLGFTLGFTPRSHTGVESTSAPETTTKSKQMRKTRRSESFAITPDSAAPHERFPADAKTLIGFGRAIKQGAPLA